MKRTGILAVTAALSAACALFPAGAMADTTIGFDDLAPGTTVTTQYADVGGAGQGVVFGPLPGDAGSGLLPVVRTPPAGQAQSGTQVADIATCTGCGSYTPMTTGTFAVARSRVSVYVGYLGTATACFETPADLGEAFDPRATSHPECAGVTLLAFDAAGNQVAASTQVILSRGAGVHTQLSVSTPSATIVGFEITARAGADQDKQIAIDDLTFDTPPSSTTPDFTLNPAATTVQLTQGGTASDAVTIGRLGGSTGTVAFSASPPPSGVHLSIVPSLATSSTVISLSADVDATITTGTPITITGTPAGPGVGPGPRSFTLTVTVQPAFTLSVVGPTSFSLATCAISVPLQIARNGSFAGPVGLSVSGVPPGVSTSFDPYTVVFSAGVSTQTSTLTLSTLQSSQDFLPHTVTIHATSPPYTERTTTITVAGTCQPQYSPEIYSMQVTQGTQLPELPQRNATNPAAAIPYASIASLAKPGSLEALAELAASRATFVRVYAQLLSGPASIIPVPAVLHGYRMEGRRRVELRGSPILPVSENDGLVLGLSQRIPDLQDLASGSNGVYEFVLPQSWTHGSITLTADLLPQPVNTLPGGVNAHAAAGTPTPWYPCPGTACGTFETFSISGVPFRSVAPATIRPVAMIIKQPYDATLPDPESVFSWARQVTPRPLIIEPYASTIDISDVLAQPDKDGSQTVAMLNDIRDYVCAHGSPAHGWVIGVEHANVRTAEQESWCVDYLPPGWHDIYFAVVNAPQPLRSVAHELFHLFGLPHASACNGANIGIGGGTVPAENWPPDMRGELQSVGLAVTPGGSPNPFTVFSSAPGQSYDLMSYCASGGQTPLTAPDNAWVSVHNWNALMDTPAPDLDRRKTGTVRHAASHAVSALDVTATVTPGGAVTIDDVSPTRAGLPTDGPSAYHLVATDASGRTKADVPMLVTSAHIDGQPPVPILSLRGVVPASSTSEVAISSAGVTLAVRHKAARPPTVRITGLPRLHRGIAQIRWRATGSGPASLDVVVQYSGDGGRSWAPIWIGPNLGHALVPSRYLFRSSDARIRIDAHDGFQTAQPSRDASAPRVAPLPLPSKAR
jgi:hypothetical protein